MKNSKQYLQQKRLGWYVQVDVPKALQPILGRTRISKTLQTRDLVEANRKKVPVVQAIFKLFDDAKAGKVDQPELAIARAEVAIARLEGASEETLSRLYDEHYFEAVYQFENSNPGAIEAVDVAHGKRKLIRDELVGYKDHRLDFDGAVPKTIAMEQAVLAILAEKFRYVDELNSKNIQAWVDVDLNGQALSTLKKKVSSVRQFLKYCGSDEELRGIPNEQTVPKALRKKSKEDLRQAFEPEDVVKIYNAVPDTDDNLRHLIRLGAYTGCRIDELCSLTKARVKGDCFQIRDAKTEAGNRDVPIHSKVKQLVAMLMDTDIDEYLLPNLTFNKFGTRADAIGKRFGRLKAKLGYDERYVFHSIRKTFISQLEDGTSNESVVAAIVGHEYNTMTFGHYSKGPTMQVKRDTIERVGYPNW